jgi:hypothetical protein
MSITINYANTVQVNGRLTQSASGTVTTEAFVEINVRVPAAEGEAPSELNVSVLSGDAEIRFLSITSSVLDPGLTYSVQGGTADIQLDSDQVFSGAGMLSLLGASPTQLSFSNGTPREARIRMIVGAQASLEEAEE